MFLVVTGFYTFSNRTQSFLLSIYDELVVSPTANLSKFHSDLFSESLCARVSTYHLTATLNTSEISDHTTLVKTTTLLPDTPPSRLYHPTSSPILHLHHHHPSPGM